MSQPDDFQNTLKDICVFSVSGGSAMLARILVSKDKNTAGYYIRRMTAGAIVSVFVGFALQDQIQSLAMRYAAVGLAGAASPEIIDFSLSWVGAKLKKVRLP
jgi:hypothetical protein